MAVAGINNVSVLESSYLGDNYSPVSRRWGNQERPITRTSFIRKMWRDLESESRISEIERKQTSGTGNSNMGSQCSCSSEGAESEDMSINTSEAENECPPDNQNSCLQHSPVIGVADKERVRQVFREWGSKNNNGCALNVSHKNNCSRVQSISENESKRVRTVRLWLESNSHQAETRVGERRSIRGRQALLDLLARFKMEREKELQGLLGNRPVSTFAHRNRIQALLKGRFLWNQKFVQDEKPASPTASELGLLRQTHTVSDLRKGFLSRVDNHEQTHDGPLSDTSSLNGMKYQENQFVDDIINKFDTSSHNDMNYQENQLLDDIVNKFDNEGQQLPPPTEIIESRDEDQGQEGSVERNQGAHEMEPAQQTLELKSPAPSQYQSDGDELEVNETFDHLNPSETNTEILSWEEGSEEAEDSLTNSQSIESLNANSIENEDEWYQESHDDVWYDNNHPFVRTDAFYTSDDDNGNRLELQQLMSRRTVSNLLQSDFRVRLDQLIKSYMVRKDQAESDDDWMPETELQNPDLQSVDENDDVTESVEITEPEINQHSGTEWEIINGLSMDMIRLQERMNSMQNTLETCMKMQLELQRSVQQEVSSALNRSSNSGEEILRTCFLCCDGNFDSSPDRCGHVYVCSNCAEKINWSKLKESVRHP